ncbi:MAG TPA: hypothetical protein VJ723_01980 [Candidatus Angelobacter sp.]|nr:hypothetical protein [Candidatus Angelobacter sp.]
MKSTLLKLTLTLLFSAATLYGQGCVQCATSAHGAGPGGESALLKGMMFLLLPSLAILSGISVVVYRNRTSRSLP